MGYSFWLAIRVLLYAPSHSTYHGLCYTTCGSQAGMRNSSMGQWGETIQSVNKYSEAWKVQVTMGHQHVSSWHGVRSSLHAKQAAVFRRQGAYSPLIQLNLAKPIQLGFLMCTHLSWAHTCHVHTLQLSAGLSVYDRRLVVRSNPVRGWWKRRGHSDLTTMHRTFKNLL